MLAGLIAALWLTLNLASATPSLSEGEQDDVFKQNPVDVDANYPELEQNRSLPWGVCTIVPIGNGFKCDLLPQPDIPTQCPSLRDVQSHILNDLSAGDKAGTRILGYLHYGDAAAGCGNLMYWSDAKFVIDFKPIFANYEDPEGIRLWLRFDEDIIEGTESCTNSIEISQGNQSSLPGKIMTRLAGNSWLWSDGFSLYDDYATIWVHPRHASDPQSPGCFSRLGNIHAEIDFFHSGSKLDKKTVDADDAAETASVLPVLKDTDGVTDDVKLIPAATPNPNLSNNAIRQGGSIVGTTSDSSPATSGNVASASSQPDLKLSGLSVRGKGVNSGSDCDPGKNTIHVQVENAGSVLAQDFRVRLLVDGSEVDSEKIDKLDAGKKESVEFKDVELKSGQRTIKAVADASASVAESSESNNELQMQVSCAAE
jgi:hypothetical protein